MNPRRVFLLLEIQSDAPTDVLIQKPWLIGTPGFTTEVLQAHANVATPEKAEIVYRTRIKRIPAKPTKRRRRRTRR